MERLKVRPAYFASLLLVSGLALWLHSQSTTISTLDNPPEHANEALLLTLGLTDEKETSWNGYVTLEGGELVKLQGYELRTGDMIHPPNRWEVSSRNAFLFQRRPHDEGFLKEPEKPILLTPRLLLYLRTTPATRVAVVTEQGRFSFTLADLKAYEPKTFLDGRVSVQRVPYPTLVGRTGSEPEAWRLTDNDYPALTVASDGSVWICWQGFRPWRDAIYVQQVRHHELGRSRGETFQVSRPGDVFRCAVAEDAERKIWVVWSQRVDDNWDLYARSYDGETWSEVIRLTNASQPDTQHRLVADSKGNLHLVWQGFRANHARIFYKHYSPQTGWSAEQQISAEDAGNCWEPAVAVDSADTLYVAWDQYGANSYDIKMRSLANNQWSNIVDVAVTPLFEAYPSLTVDPQDRLWIAWHESGVNWGKDYGNPYHIKANATGLYTSRRIRIVTYVNGRFQQPAVQLADALPPSENNFYEFPVLATDGRGNIWAFFRHRRPMQYNVYSRTPAHHALWEIYASYYNGDQWSPMILIPLSTGRNDMRIGVAQAEDGSLVLTYPTDRRSFRDWVNALSDVFVTRLEPAAGRDVKLALKDYQPPKVSAEPIHPNEDQDVQRMRAYRYVVNGEVFRAYRGDMHRHTEISWDGYNDGPTEDTYRYAIDATSLDYLAVTEHLFGILDEYDWWRSQKFADLFRVGRFFVPLFAYERSVPYPNGHRNIVFSYRGAPPLDVQHYEYNPGGDYQRQGAERLFGYLRKYKGIAMPHTTATNMGTDWRDYDPEVEPLVEIYQSDRNNYECADCWRAAPPDRPAEQFGGYRSEGFVANAWAKGYRLGVQASSDHLATHTSYAVLIARENTREALLEAIRQRRAYGATDNILVDFRLIEPSGKEHLMGSEVKLSAPPRFKIHVEGTAPLRDVQIVKDNKVVFAQEPNRQVVDLEFRDQQPARDKVSFYYLRVRQVDGQIAWASPIWVSVK